ncbi:hypothetical protein ACIJYG_00790 [Candidatus Pelagibacter bacterium nBUS_27]|uniref:hypothetical protein n=1 Tax=Candidatus Pelagibacter bacterium nBUS_27 TaxID=3374188 RepID=UPI003EBFA0B0
MTKNKFFNYLSLFWVIVILSQVLRHNYGIIYLSIFLLFLIVNIYIIFNSGFVFTATSYLSLQLWIFYILLIYISGVTFFYGGLSEFLTALPRMCLMPITAIFLYNFIFERNQFYVILNIYLIFGLIAAFSLIYQVYFGALDFLVPTQERQNLERYATTSGSLTAYGGTVGILLMVLVLHNKIKNSLLIFLGITLFSITGVVTLAKAGLMNVIIFLFFVIFFIRLKKKFYYLFFSIVAFFLVLEFSPEIQIYVNAAIKGLYLGTDQYQVASFEVQAIDRISRSIPKLAEHSIWNNFFGFGLIGGQGAFGLPFSESGTTHNSYTEYFNIGGVFLFINIMSLMICLMVKLNKLKKKDDLASLFFYCNLIAIINMFFFNGFIYQPTSSFVFWLSMVYVLYNEKNLNEKNL